MATVDPFNLQGGVPNLQGTMTNLQGSTPILQGSAPNLQGTPTAPAPSTPKVSYNDLSLASDGHTVVNTKTGVPYSTQQQLASDLGVSADQIQWGQIAKAPTPVTTTPYRANQVAPQQSQYQMPPTLGQTFTSTGGVSQPQTTNPFVLSQLMSALEAQVKTNNSLMGTRNLILKQLYDQPLTPDERAKVDPAILKVLDSGDRNQIDMQLRLISDQVQGRVGTLDQSVQYLTTAYNQAVQQQEQQRQDAITNVQKFVAQYGSNAGQALAALYGPQYVKQLADMGINIAGFEQFSAQNVAQQKISAQYGGAGSQISIPANTLAGKNNNPGNLRYTGQAGATQGVGGFAAFPTPEAGFQALMDQINLDASRGETVSQFINKYAPPSENDTATYISQFNKALGSTGDTPLSSLDPSQVAAFMAQKESGTTVTQSNVETVADGIVNGTIPPPTVGSRPTQYMLQLEAALQRRGFNLTQASLEYQATQKYIASSNSPQQLRLKQAISSVQQGIQQLKGDAQQWNAGGFAPLNKANLTLALNGVYGQQAQQIAADFQQQATIITDELGQTFMGGNSPTDKALSLAGQVFDINWSESTLSSALDQLDQNLTFRLNAINQPLVGGLGGNTSSYLPSAGTSGTSSSDPLGLGL